MYVINFRFINYLCCWICSSYIFHKKLNKILQEPDWPVAEYVVVIYSIKNWVNSSGTRLACCFILKLIITLFYVLSLSFVVTRCHSLSLVVTNCHSLSLIVPLVVTLCHLLFYSLSFAVTRCTNRCHLLPFVVPLVDICCHALPFVVPLVVIRCHSLCSLVDTRCTTPLPFYMRWPKNVFLHEGFQKFFK